MNFVDNLGIRVIFEMRIEMVRMPHEKAFEKFNEEVHASLNVEGFHQLFEEKRSKDKLNINNTNTSTLH